MLRALRPYFITLVIIWAGLYAAATYFAQRSPLSSHWIMTAVFAAFCFEALCYLASAFEAARTAFARIRPPALASLLLWASSLVPYILISLTGRTFESHSLTILAAASLVICFWWIVFPRRLAFDVAFLAAVAVPLVTRLFGWLYVSPVPRLDLSILGHLMWIRISLMVLLAQRQFPVCGVGLWPSPREWRIGLTQFLIAIVPVSLLAIAVRFAYFSPRHSDPAQWIGLAVGTFAGIFLVEAFSEDVFRGVITELFCRRVHSIIAAAIASALIIGAAHLWFKDFPNWRFAVVAALAHLFYTIAYLRSGSVRASMVTHALTVAAWRMFFRT